MVPGSRAISWSIQARTTRRSVEPGRDNADQFPVPETYIAYDEIRTPKIPEYVYSNDYISSYDYVKKRDTMLAVTSIGSAYASASSTATPRSFSLLEADNLSQNALSVFLGAFTIDEQLEAAGVDAFEQSRRERRMGGAKIENDLGEDNPVYCDKIGYVQHVNMEALQERAKDHAVRVTLSAVPGTSIAPGRPLAFVHSDDDTSNIDDSVIASTFEIGESRVYDDEPRALACGERHRHGDHDLRLSHSLAQHLQLTVAGGRGHRRPVQSHLRAGFVSGRHAR